MCAAPSTVIRRVRSALGQFWADETGASAVEYGLLAAILALAIVGAVQALGISLSNTFNQVASLLPGH